MRVLVPSLACCLALGACLAAPPPPPQQPPSPAAAPLAAPAPTAGEPAAPPASPAAAPRPTPERSARVHFDDRIEAASPPLVDAMVGGQPTTLIVDTGATHHIIAGWLARELPGAVARPVGRATDHGGKAVTLSVLDGVNLVITGYGRVASPSLLVVEVPDELRRRGIGGVISPQSLVTEGRAVLLDLQGGTLTDVAAADGQRRLESRGRPFDGILPCAGAGGAAVLVTAATIDGVEASLQLDTGATTSSLFAASPPGKRLGQRSRGTSTQLNASGAHTVSTVPGAHVRLGPFESELDLALLGRAPSCGEGYAGMDVLRSCAVLIGGAGSRLWCAPRR
jgi:hypothetical protein